MRRAWWLLAPCLVACSSGTRIVLTVEAMPEVGALETLTLGVEPAGMTAREFALASPPELPGTVVIGAPDDIDVDLRVTGRAVDTRLWMAATRVHTERGQSVSATLRLGDAPMADLATDDAVIDAGVADLAVDAALIDLKLPDAAPDLRPAVTYRRKVTVTAGAALPQGYTIRVPLEANFLATAQGAGKLRADRNDLRLRTVGGQERNRILDETPPGELPAVWFSLSTALAASTATDYYLHYGALNPGVAPADGTAVFLMYDLFTGNTLSAMWQANATPVVTGGVVRMDQNQMDAITTPAGNNPLPVTAVVEGRLRVTNAASLQQVVNTDNFWWWFGFQHNGDFSASEPWVIWIQRAVNQAQAEVNIAGGPCTVCFGASFTLDNSFHVYRVERTAADSAFYRDGVLRVTHTAPNTSQMAPLIRNYSVTSDLELDWFRARELRTPAPAILLGAEEIVP